MLPVKLWHTILTVTASFTIDIKRYSLPSGEQIKTIYKIFNLNKNDKHYYILFPM